MVTPPSSAQPLFTCAKAEAVVAHLEHMISQADKNSHSILRKFGVPNGPKFAVKVHCETLVTALMKHPDLATPYCDPHDPLPVRSNFTLWSLLSWYAVKDFNCSGVGVSKASCPTCTEFMICSSDGDDLAFLASHSSIFPVDLPHWLPACTIKSMVTRFEPSILQELLKLSRNLEQPQSLHTNDASLQSETSYCSNASTENKPNYLEQD